MRAGHLVPVRALNFERIALTGNLAGYPKISQVKINLCPFFTGTNGHIWDVIFPTQGHPDSVKDSGFSLAIFPGQSNHILVAWKYLDCLNNFRVFRPKFYDPERPIFVAVIASYLLLLFIVAHCFSYQKTSGASLARDPGRGEVLIFIACFQLFDKLLNFFIDLDKGHQFKVIKVFHAGYGFRL